MLRSSRILLPVLLLLAVAACGDDDERDAAAGDCEPVGADLAPDADDTVDIDLAEYAFTPNEVSVDAGVVTFRAHNEGEQRHELAFLPGGGDVPFTADGAPDEDALSQAGAFELEGFSPDQTCRATFALEAGTYTLFCVVEADDGQTHYEKGMHGTLQVS